MRPALAAAVAHLLTTAAYLGFQVTVRVLVYPQMAGVPAAAFPGYEREHQRRVSLVVGPLFAGLAVTTLGLLVAGGVPWWARVGAAASFGGILAVTVLGAVPEHGRLSSGWDAAAHRRLLRADTARVALAAAGVAVAVAAVVAVT